MDNRYEVFCLADPYFYESVERISANGSGEAAGAPGDATGEAPGTRTFPTALRATPPGWRTSRSGDWLHIDPLPVTGRPEPPAQGWKIHVTATQDNADAIAAAVWDYCVPRHIPFKFVPTAQLLHLRNSKYAGRDTSGKFVTIYPPDEERLATVLRDLDERIGGELGPYILTDLRWRQGPLYVRYGAFAKRYCVGGQGTLVPAIEDAGGRLVPDDRSPAFRVPEWVTLPVFLKPHLDARNATTVGDLPYRIEKALHFSNGGGVYVGTDTRDGSRVVLKEGRPMAGLAADGADAVTRLERERDALQRLSGLGVAPEVRDWFTLGDHRFLVMEHIDGKPLNSYFAHRHPLLTPDPDPAEVAEYTSWALRVHARVEQAVRAVHARGVVFHDLHMFNIMIGPDDESVTLLDFEAATLGADNRRQSVAHPGFFAPPDRRGYEVDRYALACLRLALFLPSTTLFVMDRTKAEHLADLIAEHFPVPRDFLDEAVAEITRGLAARPGPAAPAAPAGAADADRAAGTGAGTDTAGAADAGGPAGTGGGATAPRPPGRRGSRFLPAETTHWPAARDSALAGILASATPGRDDRLFPGDIRQFGDGGGLGLAHGAAGVLYALTELGLPRRPEHERWLLERTDPLPPGTPLGLYDGTAGIAHVLDRLGRTDRALDLIRRLLDENWLRLTSDLYGGLAGIGLVLDDLARRTGDRALADHALEAASVVAQRLADADAADKSAAARSAAAGTAPAAGPGDPGSGGGPANTGTGGGGPGGPGRTLRRAGLMHGATGPALLFLRLYERTANPALLIRAAHALHRDLDMCVPTASGGLDVDEGWRTMPYLGEGSVGIGMVLDDWLRLAATAGGPTPGMLAGSVARFEQARTGIVRAATARFYAQPALLAGRAGMILHLARTTAAVPDGALAAQIDALGWHGMVYRGHLAFPGHQMMRLSMDLATGTAGCLLALGAALGDTHACLPFLPPLTRRPGQQAAPATETGPTAVPAPHLPPPGTTPGGP